MLYAQDGSGAGRWADLADQLEGVRRLTPTSNIDPSNQTDLNDRLEFLEESRHSHFNLTKAVAASGVTMVTIFAWMVLKRSISLIYGYTALIKQRNFVSAAPLIRLQLDNLQRFRAAFIAPDTDQFIASVLEGEHIRTLRDKRGQKMTDSYLQGRFKPDYPWLEGLYRTTSGYVHLSDSHFANAIRATAGGKDGEIQAYIRPDDQMIPDDVYAEATEDMITVTNAHLSFMADWARSIGPRI